MGIATYDIDFLYTHLFTYSNARATFVDLAVNMSRSSQGCDLHVHIHCCTKVSMANCQVSMKSFRRLPRKIFYRGFTIYTCVGMAAILVIIPGYLSTHKIPLRRASSFVQKNHGKLFFFI